MHPAVACVGQRDQPQDQWRLSLLLGLVGPEIDDPVVLLAAPPQLGEQPHVGAHADQQGAAAVDDLTQQVIAGEARIGQQQGVGGQVGQHPQEVGAFAGPGVAAAKVPDQARGDVEDRGEELLRAGLAFAGGAEGLFVGRGHGTLDPRAVHAKGRKAPHAPQPLSPRQLPHVLAQAWPDDPQQLGRLTRQRRHEAGITLPRPPPAGVHLHHHRAASLEGVGEHPGQIPGQEDGAGHQHPRNPAELLVVDHQGQPAAGQELSDGLSQVCAVGYCIGSDPARVAGGVAGHHGLLSWFSWPKTVYERRPSNARQPPTASATPAAR